jgi:cysteine desulfurase / selenocysteine lyase
MIYLDNAATTWPKPPQVLKAMSSVLERAGGNPGRSGHRLSVAAAREIYDTREDLARFFHISDPLRVIFTGGATHALNLALKGLLKPGDNVVATSMEHNAAMRPLRYLEKKGVSIKVVRCASDGTLDPDEVAKVLNSKTRLIVCVHGSNVTGTILPVAEVASIAHEAGAFLLVDAAQTAGALPIDVTKMGIDLLAFTGHKELLGPPGTGGLIIADRVDVTKIESLMQGGTGSNSESEEHPGDMPDKFECGTPNLPGIAGLHAGIRWINAKGIEEIRDHHKKITAALIDGLSNLKGIKLYGTLDAEHSAAIVSFTVTGKNVSEIGFRLDEKYGILCRVGLHCAPAAHRTIGSFPEGTVRLSPGISTTMDEISTAVKAIGEIIKS